MKLVVLRYMPEVKWIVPERPAYTRKELLHCARHKNFIRRSKKNTRHTQKKALALQQGLCSLTLNAIGC